MDGRLDSDTEVLEGIRGDLGSMAKSCLLALEFEDSLDLVFPSN